MMSSRRGPLGLLILSLLGLSLCLYLTYLHLGLLRGEVLGGLACGGSGLFNCHAVTASRWGSVLGIPLSLWGLLGYAAAVQLALFAWLSPEWRTSALLLLAGFGALWVSIDAGLAVVMAVQIRHLCPLCLLTYAVNLILLVGAKQALSLPWSQVWQRLPQAWASLWPSSQRPYSIVFWTTTAGAALAILAFHAAILFVTHSDPALLRSQLRDFVAQQPPGVPDVTGDPARGPDGGGLQVVEFSDFLCPVCRRASKFNEILLTNHRREMRFVFKQFPLDMTCNATINHTVHPGACAVAAASECVHRQGKFWPFHDVVFQDEGTYEVSRLAEDAAGLGLDRAQFDACMSSGQGMAAVQRDITEGQRLGVISTPTYFINGYRFSGLLPPHIFEEIVAVVKERH